MSNSFDELERKIRAIAEVECENQMYVWPGVDPSLPNPRAFFKRLGIKFDGGLFIRYAVRKTFSPVAADELVRQEQILGLALPTDYKRLLATFGPVHLPGKAGVIIETPLDAINSTRQVWCYDPAPLSVLAISTYNQTSDGNSIGFLRNGDGLGPELFEFDHELFRDGANPVLWTRKVSNSLSEFLIEFLNR